MKKLLLILVLVLGALAVFVPTSPAQVLNWDNNRINSSVPFCLQPALTATVTSAASNLNDVCLGRLEANVFKIYTNDLSTTGAIVAKVRIGVGGTANPGGSLGAYQGTTSVGITTANFTALVAAASDIAIPANSITAGKRIRVRGSGVYTNAAASLLNAELMLCTVSGCGSGTVVAPAGCAIVSTNQANNLTNGQFTFDCTLTATATVGASGTFMAKGQHSFNLGAATSAVQSVFADTATAASAAVDETVAEYVNIAFKFTTSNAGNSAILHEYVVEILNN